MTTNHNIPVWITTDELAAMVHVARNCIERKRCLGHDLPPHYKVGGRVLYKLAECVEWIERTRSVPLVDVQAQEKKAA